MAASKKYGPGEFCWTDLGTTDVAGAKKFYRAIFGWKAKDIPMGVGDAKYSILQLNGKDSCAIYPMPEEQKKMKAPPFWLGYISVANIDQTLKKAKSAGGKICAGPADVMDRGVWALVQDPTGAAFALWQPGKRRGADLVGKPGGVCWHDLSTPKTGPAGKFYAKVFGWKVKEEDIGGGSYHLFQLNGKEACGMWPEPMKGLPPMWITYWTVPDCGKAVAKTGKLGGKVLMGATPIPNMGRFAVLTDPQGAAFGIFGK